MAPKPSWLTPTSTHIHRRIRRSGTMGRTTDLGLHPAECFGDSLTGSPGKTSAAGAWHGSDGSGVWMGPARVASEVGGARHKYTHHVGRSRHPTEDATLGSDHAQADLVELREVGGAAIGDDDATIAAIVGLAHCGMHADFGRHAAHQQSRNATVTQHQVEVCLIEGTL